MNNWIKVECPKCEGTGSAKEERWFEHPNSFRYVSCPTCLGHGMLLARPVEVKPLEDPEDKVVQ